LACVVSATYAAVPEMRFARVGAVRQRCTPAHVRGSSGRRHNAMNVETSRNVTTGPMTASATIAPMIS
jgi:hypothetical protein